MFNKKKIRNFLIYFIPGLIVCLIMLSIFFIKHMYPFGNVASLQIDADYNYVPVLFKIYDIFHYGDSFLWDFKLGGGANIYGSLVMNSIYSPLNWLVIFCRRGNIVNFFNILLIIKFSCMAITMFIFIRKNFDKVEFFWQVILSLLYVFSGWGFLMYSNIFFIDTIILFPIVMHYLFKFFKNGKSLGLIISLSYSLILNVYLSYMIYLFIIFCSLFILIFLVDKHERKTKIIKLSFSFVFPLIISAFASWPTVVQIISSVRGVSERRAGYFYYFFLKFINLTMSSLLIALFSRGINKDVLKDRENWVLFILLFITTVGVIIEPINCMWHTGSYNSFPYRYSFISLFVIICGCLSFLSKHNNFNIKSHIKYRYILFIILMCEIIIIIFLDMFGSMIIKEMIAFDITRVGIFLILLIVFGLLYIMYIYIFKIYNFKLQRILIIILLVFEIGIYSNWCFNDYEYHQSNLALEYMNNFNIDDDSLYKYIDYQGELGVNSSYITDMATVSNWLHIIPKKQYDFVNKFGYANNNSLIYGYGGTIITDSLIGVKYLYSQMDLPTDVFKLIDERNINEKDVSLYQFRYPMSFGLKYVNKIEPKKFDSIFDEQNYYCRSILDIDYNIINVGSIDIIEKNNSYTIYNDEPVILYFEVTDELLKGKFEKITVNGQDVSFGNSRKIVYLDEYKDSIEIEIEKKQDDSDNDIKTFVLKYGYIKVSDYKKIVKKIQNNYNKFEYKGNKLYINIDSDKEQYLFLPINNIAGWIAKNNGKRVSVDDELYLYMSIKLEKGNNNLELEFFPPLLKESIFVSSVSILLLILYCWIEEKLTNNKLVQKIVVPIYYFVSVSLLIYIYIISNFIY